MRVELGERVRSSDGVDLGYVRNLVVDPNGGGVCAVVLEKGVFFPHDIEVPIQDLVAGTNNDTRVKYKADDMTNVRPFEKDRYEELAPPFAIRAGYPNGGLLWPVGVPYPSASTGFGTLGVFAPPGDVTGPPPAAGVDRAAVPPLSLGAVSPNRGQPGEPAPVHEMTVEHGSRVVTRDGDKVGVVERVAFDAVSGRPITLVVRRGTILTEDLEIPGEKIESLDDDQVTLDMTKQEFDTWTTAPSVPYV